MARTVTYGTGPGYTISTARETMHTMAAHMREVRGLDLAAIAREHATSRVLSESTRAYFDRLSRRGPIPREHVDWAEADEAYFEAAASCATRGAQSMERRSMAARLYALRTADLAGEAIGPRVRTYPVVIAGEVEATLTVTRALDGTVSADLDADLDALD